MWLAVISTFVTTVGAQTFLSLSQPNFASGGHENSNNGNCAAAHAAGHFQSRVAWTALRWHNESLLRADVSDRTYATVTSGTGFRGAESNVQVNLGDAYDCTCTYSTSGESVIDLRGTPYRIADAESACTRSCSGGCTRTCSQWTVSGWDPGITLNCTHDGQRCSARCGGCAGACSLSNGYLQLEWMPSWQPPLSPPPPFVATAKLDLTTAETLASSYAYGGWASRPVAHPPSSYYQSANGSCSHTQQEADPWWSVNLGGTFVVSHIRVLPRGWQNDQVNHCGWSTCASQLDGFSVSVSGTTCASDVAISQANVNSWLTISCAGATGNVLRISLTGQDRMLMLCGVEVYTHYSPPSPAPLAPPSLPPQPSPPPPSMSLALGAHDSLATAIASAVGVPLTLELQSGHALTGTLDASRAPSAISLVAETPGTPLTTRLTIETGAPPLHLRGFALTGSIQVEGGHLHIAECSFTAASEGGGGGIGGEGGGAGNGGGGQGGAGRRLSPVPSPEPLVVVRGGEVDLEAMHFVNVSNAVQVHGGRLRLASSVLLGNSGSLHVTGGAALVADTRFEDDALPAVRVDGGAVTLSNKTVINQDSGIAVMARNGSVTYVLPAPLGRWVFISDGTDTATLPPGAALGSYPFACSAGTVGDSYERQSQSTPSCARPCPEGSFCDTATTVPLACPNGTYCGPASPAPTDCPIGTFGPQPELKSVRECVPCPPGSACLRGSFEPTLCAPGRFAASARTGQCSSCLAGKYQDAEGGTGCHDCYVGFYCRPGSPLPTPCMAGTWSNRTDLQREQGCEPCPVGHYCIPGTSAPTACAAGTFSKSERQTDARGCQACPSPSWSPPGSADCDMCESGHYLDTQSDQASCEVCPTGAVCESNATLATINLTVGFWRFGPLSIDVSDCDTATEASGEEWSPCRGGTEAGVLGDGYCEPGYGGPLCKVCQPDAAGAIQYYYRSDEAACVLCPVGVAARNMSIILAVVALLVALGLLLRLPPCYKALAHCVLPCYQKLERFALRILMKVRALSLVPKFKMLVAFYQSVSVLPSVYNLSLPARYYSWLSFLNVFEFDWSGVVIPGSCLPGGYYNRLMLRGLVPLALLFCVFVIAVVVNALRACCHSQRRVSANGAAGAPPVPLAQVFRRSLLNALPLVLFICFCLCASTSSGIFASWGCVEYSSSASSSSTFLRTDLSLQCTDNGVETPEYTRVRQLATAFVFLWPVAMPILFLAVLLPSRASIRHGRVTRLVRATAFLHREYEAPYFFWEPFFLLQRLLLVGFVQIIPRRLEYARIVAGALVTTSYLAALLSTKPYKRFDNDVIAISMQAALVLIFFMAQTVLLFNGLDALGEGLTGSVLGVSSLDELVTCLVACNLIVLVCFTFLLLCQALSHRTVPVLRLVATKQPPELKLAKDMRYHLFLSHIWSTGQDTSAVVKRQLNLLMPTIRVFLDVDDLEEIGDLEGYIETSQCVLVLLTRGYFHSANCLREVTHAIETRRPLALVHEADLAKGGAPLADLRADADAKGVDTSYLFEGGWPLVEWHRVSEFQMLSLRLIAEATVRAMPQQVLEEVSTAKPLTRLPRASSVGPTDPPLGSLLYIPGEMTRRVLDFPTPVLLYASPSNPGAAELGAELCAKYGERRDTVRVTMRPPASFHVLHDGAATTARRPSAEPPTHMLLYLAQDTFCGQGRQGLAKEIEQALDLGVPIVLVHECDAARGGCEFARFFQTTPQPLVDRGLYHTIAVACHTQPHRGVSLALVALACGAHVADGLGLRKAMLRLSRGSRCSRMSANSSGAPEDGSEGAATDVPRSPRDRRSQMIMRESRAAGHGAQDEALRTSARGGASGGAAAVGERAAGIELEQREEATAGAQDATESEADDDYKI